VWHSWAKKELHPNKIPFFHCRAGVGRTGTVISGLVINELSKGKIDKHFFESEQYTLNKLKDIVLTGRKARGPLFVQNASQFQLLAEFVLSKKQAFDWSQREIANQKSVISKDTSQAINQLKAAGYDCFEAENIEEATAQLTSPTARVQQMCLWPSSQGKGIISILIKPPKGLKMLAHRILPEQLKDKLIDQVRELMTQDKQRFQSLIADEYQTNEETKDLSQEEFVVKFLQNAGYDCFLASNNPDAFHRMSNDDIEPKTIAVWPSSLGNGVVSILVKPIDDREMLADRLRPYDIKNNLLPEIDYIIHRCCDA